MKKDKLKIDFFTDEKGKNNRIVKKQNKRIIKDFIEKDLVYNVLEINQLWRHVHAKLEKENKIFFFKMSSTKEIGERTYNETEWNKQINRIIKEKNIDSFKTPEIIQTGHFKENFYYISDFFSGNLLATDNPPKINNLNKWINKIIDLNFFLLNIKKLDLPRDKDREKISKKEKEERYTKFILNLYEQVKDHNLYEILEKIKDLKNTYQPAVNHNDFSPWHMIKDHGKIVLIDGESASSYSPKYYDIVHFYHRLYTAGENPDLAKRYLNKVKGKILLENKDEFDQSILPILASRIIGGYWDEKTTGREYFNFHDELKNDFFKNHLY